MRHRILEKRGSPFQRLSARQIYFVKVKSWLEKTETLSVNEVI